MRTAIIGAGFIADYHMQVLRRLDGIAVVGVCDRDIGRARRFAERWGIAGVYASVDDLVSHEVVDVAHVLVPPPLHIGVASRVVEAGTAVFVEKPLGLDGRSCKELIGLVVKTGVPLAVNHSAIFHPAFRRLLQDVRDQKFGRLEHVICSTNASLRQLTSGEFDHWMFQDPLNVFLEQAPHPLSQIRLLLGAPRAARSLVTGKRLLPGQRVFYDTWRIALECERGTAMLAMAFNGDFPETWLHVVGEDGSAHVDLLHNTYSTRRRTRYVAPVDGWLTDLSVGGRHILQATRSLSNYFLATVRRTRADAFQESIGHSVAAFYRHRGLDLPAGMTGSDGLSIVEACDLVRTDLNLSASAARPSFHRTRQESGADVLVLGATGFIGSHLVERLHTAGYRVRIMTRRPASLPLHLQSLPIEIFTGDIMQQTDVDRAVSGVRFVYHLAAGAASHWTEFENLYVRGVRNVAKACRGAGVRRLLFTSTIAVYYLGDRRQVITEETPLDSRPTARGYYARAKILCEQLLKEEQRRGLPVVIVRPGVVVGPRGRPEHSGVGWWPNPTHCLAWGNGRNGLPFVLVQDVAEALLRAMTAEGIDGQSFNLVGDVTLPARGYVAYLAGTARRDIRLHARPFWRILAVELSKWAIKRVIGRKDNPFPSPRDFRSRRLLSRFDCSRAKQVLSWKPVSELAEFLDKGLRQEIAPRVSDHAS